MCVHIKVAQGHDSIQSGASDWQSLWNLDPCGNEQNFDYKIMFNLIKLIKMCNTYYGKCVLQDITSLDQWIMFVTYFTKPSSAPLLDSDLFALKQLPK